MEYAQPLQYKGPGDLMIKEPVCQAYLGDGCALEGPDVSWDVLAGCEWEPECLTVGHHLDIFLCGAGVLKEM